MSKDDMDIKNKKDLNIDEDIKIEEKIEKNEKELEEKIEVKENDDINTIENKLDEDDNKYEIDGLDSNPSFLKKLFASVLDQAVILGMSAIILLIFDLVIGLLGYMIIEPTSILLIIYVIVNVFYLPLFEIKNKRTIGKRILSIV